MANDVFWPKKSSLKSIQHPTINTLELISVLPLNLIKLRCKINNQHRYLLKIEYCTKRQLIFEFGGFTHRKVNHYLEIKYKLHHLL